MPREGDDRHVGLRALERSRCNQAVHAQHRDVDHDDIGLQGLRLPEDAIAVSRLADDLHVGLTVDQQLQAVTDRCVVVCEQDAERHGHLSES